MTEKDYGGSTSYSVKDKINNKSDRKTARNKKEIDTLKISDESGKLSINKIDEDMSDYARAGKISSPAARNPSPWRGPGRFYPWAR